MALEDKYELPNLCQQSKKIRGYFTSVDRYAMYSMVAYFCPYAQDK